MLLFLNKTGDSMIILWLLPLFAILHIVEEFVYPGGFLEWYRNYKSSIAPSFTVKYIVVINLILIILCILPFAFDIRHAISLWLSMASVIFFNALFHIKGVIKLKRYSPGIITSLLLYIPLTIYGYWFALSNNLASIETAISSFIVGVIYVWFSSFNHGRRAKKSYIWRRSL